MKDGKVYKEHAVPWYGEANIEIAFPQLDLHLRNAESSIIVRLSVDDSSYDKVISRKA